MFHTASEVDPAAALGDLLFETVSVHRSCTDTEQRGKMLVNKTFKGTELAQTVSTALWFQLSLTVQTVR